MTVLVVDVIIMEFIGLFIKYYISLSLTVNAFNGVYITSIMKLRLFGICCCLVFAVGWYLLFAIGWFSNYGLITESLQLRQHMCIDLLTKSTTLKH